MKNEKHKQSKDFFLSSFGVKSLFNISVKDIDSARGAWQVSTGEFKIKTDNGKEYNFSGTIIVEVADE